MKVVLFQQRFAHLVKSGLKRQTIRLTRRIPIIVGDVLSLRQWAHLPYRSKQIELIDPVRCSFVSPISITIDSKNKMRISTPSCMVAGLREFAEADGFINEVDMAEWFLDNHGPEFDGSLIQWDPPRNVIRWDPS